MFIPFVVAGVVVGIGVVHKLTAPRPRAPNAAPPAEAPGPVGIAFAMLGTGVSVARSVEQLVQDNLAGMRNNATRDVTTTGAPLRDRAGAMRDNVGAATALMNGALNRELDRAGAVVMSTQTGAAVKDAVNRTEETAAAKAADVARLADANAAGIVRVATSPPPPPPTFRRPF